MAHVAGQATNKLHWASKFSSIGYDQSKSKASDRLIRSLSCSPTRISVLSKSLWSVYLNLNLGLASWWNLKSLVSQLTKTLEELIEASEFSSWSPPSSFIAHIIPSQPHFGSPQNHLGLELSQISVAPNEIRFTKLISFAYFAPVQSACSASNGHLIGCPPWGGLEVMLKKRRKFHFALSLYLSTHSSYLSVLVAPSMVALVGRLQTQGHGIESYWCNWTLWTVKSVNSDFMPTQDARYVERRAANLRVSLEETKAIEINLNQKEPEPDQRDI